MNTSSRTAGQDPERYPVFDDHAASIFLQELISHASACLQAALATQLGPMDHSGETNVFSSARTVANSAAMVAKILWPNVRKEVGESPEAWARRKRLASLRGPALREMLDIPDNSPLRNTQVRNAIEHYDERLDRRLSSKDRNIIMNTIGPPNAVHIEGSTEPFYLRHYDPQTSIYTILGATLNIRQTEEAMANLLQAAIMSRAEIEARRMAPRH